jgi:hypothetical protein
MYNAIFGKPFNEFRLSSKLPSLARSVLAVLIHFFPRLCPPQLRKLPENQKVILCQCQRATKSGRNWQVSASK